MRTNLLPLLAAVSVIAAPASGQDSAGIVPPPATGVRDVAIDFSARPVTSWPTWHGDWTGQHYSPLTQINRRTIKSLSLAWTHHLTTGNDLAIAGRLKPDRAVAEAPRARFGSGTSQKGSPLMLDGVLYMAVGSQIQAIDARLGQLIWRFNLADGTFGRGVAAAHDLILAQTTNNWLVAIDIRTGKQRWAVQVEGVPAGASGNTAPVIMGEHAILGMGGDGVNVPGWIESRDPRTGAFQWRFYTSPRAGEPGIETWPSVEAAAHSGGMPWNHGTYDPELKLAYIPIGNPVPVFNGKVREGANLYSNCLVALNVETGKLVWYFQTTPHDTHDYDGNHTGVLIDGVIDGRPRKLIAQLNRNGLYFLLDRVTGENIVSVPFAEANWYKGFDKRGQPIPDPDKEPSRGGALVSPSSDGAIKWLVQTFNPRTGMMYTAATDTWSTFFLNDKVTDPQGWGGGAEYHSGYLKSAFKALDYRTGRVVWQHDWPGVFGYNESVPGMLSTAGDILFTGDPYGNLVAFDLKKREIVWTVRLNAQIENPPISYMLDGKQYVLVAAQGSYYAFALQ